MKDYKERPENFVCVLPSVALSNYLSRNKLRLLECVIDTIQYAVDNQLESVEMFKFNKSKFAVLLTKETFFNNLNMIYQFYLENEMYEKCSRIIKLQGKLKKWR